LEKRSLQKNPSPASRNPNKMFVNPSKMCANPNKMFADPSKMCANPNKMFVNPSKHEFGLLALRILTLRVTKTPGMIMVPAMTMVLAMTSSSMIMDPRQ
jgi:hypothetical protein